MTMKLIRRSQIPGSRFNPTNVELVNILRRRIDRDKRSRLITDIQNLYEKEPWLLQHVTHVRFHKNEWFYFATRKKPPGMKKADSKRPSRKVAGLGRWKTTGTLVHIEDKYGVQVGSMQYISFKAKSETEKGGITTGWVMHEFLLDRPVFQELVLCRIRFNPRKDNAQYAPRLTPIMIGQPQQRPEDGLTLVEYNKNDLQVATTEEIQYLDAPVETHQDQCMEQWTGSCSGEAVSYAAAQHQPIMGQDSNYYPTLNGGMEQHQDFGSYGQQQNHILGHMEQYGQGFGDMAKYQNQYLGQETTDPCQVPMMMNQALNEEQQWNEYSGPSSAHQYLGQDMVPITQCLMIHHQEQHLAAQHQHFSVNGTMEQHQGLGSCGQFFGESSGQQQNHILEPQATDLSLIEDQQQQCQNYLLGQETDPSHLAQPMEEQQQWNKYSGLYSAQPYDQDMMEHQEFGSSAMCLAQNRQYLGQNNDLSALGELAAQQRHLGEDSNLSFTQQQNQNLGQATYLSPMEQQFLQTDYQSQLRGQYTDPSQVPIMINQTLEEQHYVPWSAQPYDQYKRQNNALPTVPMETQQQQDNVLRNSAAQLQLEEQENVPLMIQTMDEPHGGIVSSPTHNELTPQPLGDETYQDLESDMANFGNEERAQQLGQNTPEEEAELTAPLKNCKTMRDKTLDQTLEEQHYVPWSAQPYDQYKKQNNALPTVPMETQQQQDNVFRNSAAQLQLEKQENVPLMIQTIDEPQPLGRETYQRLESDMANFGNEEWAQQLGQNTPEEEAELAANCKTLDSFLNFFFPN